MCRNIKQNIADLHWYKIVFVFLIHLSLSIHISCFMRIENYLYKGEHLVSYQNLYSNLLYIKYTIKYVQTMLSIFYAFFQARRILTLNKQINVLFTNRICTKTKTKNKYTKSKTMKRILHVGHEFQACSRVCNKIKSFVYLCIPVYLCDAWWYLFMSGVQLKLSVYNWENDTIHLHYSCDKHKNLLFIKKKYQQLITFIYVILSIHDIRDYSYSVLNFTIQIISLLLKLYYMSSVMK